jgi:hypothetical protein
MVPTLLYIGRRGRVTERVIGLTYYVPSLLQQIDPSYRPDMLVLVCLDLHVGRPRQPLMADGPIARWWSCIRVVRVPLAYISDSSPHRT